MRKMLFLLLLLMNSSNALAGDANPQFVCKKHINWFTEKNVYEKRWNLHRADNDAVVGPEYWSAEYCEAQISSASTTGLVCMMETDRRGYNEVKLLELKTGASYYVRNGWDSCLSTAAIGMRYNKVCNESYQQGKFWVGTFMPSREKAVDDMEYDDALDIHQCRQRLNTLSPLKCVQLESHIAQMQFFGAVRTLDGRLTEKFAGHELATHGERAEAKCQFWIERYNRWLGTEE